MPDDPKPEDKPKRPSYKELYEQSQRREQALLSMLSTVDPNVEDWDAHIAENIAYKADGSVVYLGSLGVADDAPAPGADDGGESSPPAPPGPPPPLSVPWARPNAAPDPGPDVGAMTMSEAAKHYQEVVRPADARLLPGA